MPLAAAIFAGFGAEPCFMASIRGFEIAFLPVSEFGPIVIPESGDRLGLSEPKSTTVTGQIQLQTV
ncbi:MAG: hypothetical protein DMF61_00615 [Blastocatellia bacterium AA13]|nr:MAG: hypothetical protein DMF61_00615 [Blastocatellia bacterium AA13]